jgi:exopolysaccharide production protein ExoZ
MAMSNGPSVAGGEEASSAGGSDVSGLGLGTAPGDLPGDRPPEKLPPEVGAREQRPNATIENIQTLRALAALLVVFVHLDVFLRALGVPPFGHGGVDLFFIISGFIMVHTTRTRPISPAAFMANRFTRIAPIYWLITLFVFAVALAAPSLLQATSSDPEQLAKSLLFIPFQKSNGLVQPVLFVGWTLNYEMFFYALFAVGLCIPRRWVGAIAVGVFMLALVAFGRLVRPESVLGAFYTRPIILEFVAGMALAVLGSSARVRVRGAPARVGLLAVCAVGLLCTAFVPLVFPELSRLVTQGLPSLLVVAGAIVLHQSGVRVGGRWLLLLGNASYALYLTHPFVTQGVQKAGKLVGLTPLLAALLIPLTLLLVCVVGVVTHLAVERPLTRLVKAVMDRAVAPARRRAPAPGFAPVD